MRILLSLLLAAFSFPALAGHVTGYCERGGKSVSFVDGVAFADARDESGAITTTIYLTSMPLDRKKLAECRGCGRPLGENTLASSRGDAVDAQINAADGGWLEASHVGGEIDITTVVNVAYVAPDGTHTGIMAGNERLSFEVRDEDKHIAGKVTTEAGDYGMICDVVFDFAMGWPKPEPD